MYKIYRGDSCNFYRQNKELKEKAKLIYLDPPYNSKRSRGARKHYKDSNSNWAEVITPIVKDAFDMLSDDGFLAVSINQTELFNLKNIIDNIFGSEKFIGLFPIKIRHKDRQLMINATFHDVYEYMVIYRKNKSTRFYYQHKQPDLDKFIYKIEITDDNPDKKVLNGKEVEIYNPTQYNIIKGEPSKDNLRRYIIAGKLKTANWSGEWFENHIRVLGQDLLVKVYGLENEGLGYRWFHTQTEKRNSGIYFQSTLTAGRPILPTNDIDLTDEVTNIYKEGGEGCDFKDSKKPEMLLSWLMDITTKKDDLVIDLFGGSGTTLAVAIQKHRNCIIVEKNEEPFEIIKNRVKNLNELKKEKIKVETFKI